MKDKVVVGSKWKQKGSKSKRYLQIKSVSGKNVSFAIKGVYPNGLMQDQSMTILNLLTKYEKI